MLRYMYMCTSSAKADETWYPVFFFRRKPNIITCICILFEVFTILVASNTMQEFCKSS